MKILLFYVKCRPSTVLGLVLLTKHKWFYQAYCMKNVISASTKQFDMWKLLLVHYRKVLGLCLLLNTISVKTKTYRPRAMAMIWICRAAIQSNLSQKKMNRRHIYIMASNHWEQKPLISNFSRPRQVDKNYARNHVYINLYNSVCVGLADVCFSTQNVFLVIFTMEK